MFISLLNLLWIMTFWGYFWPPWPRFKYPQQLSQKVPQWNMISWPIKVPRSTGCWNYLPILNILVSYEAYASAKSIISLKFERSWYLNSNYIRVVLCPISNYFTYYIFLCVFMCSLNNISLLTWIPRPLFILNIIVRQFQGDNSIIFLLLSSFHREGTLHMR